MIVKQLLRVVRLFLLTILAFSFVSACGGSSPRQAGSEAVRVVDHAMGQTKVSVNPQRVVALSGSLDTVLSLGVKPVGSIQISEGNNYLKNRLEGIKSVGSFNNPSFEEIVALKPDLILGTKWDDRDKYKLLSQIAPTVIADVESSGEWKKLLNKYAEALGKTDKAEQIIGDYNARIEKFQTQMGDRIQETEVSIVRVRQDRIDIYLEDSFPGTIVADAGLSHPPDQANAEDSFSMQISKELLHIADANAIFIWTFASGNSEEADMEAQRNSKELKADPLWAKLNAVQQGKVYDVPRYWMGMGPIAANLVLDDLFEYLLEK